jgi:hypothetical protein
VNISVTSTKSPITVVDDKVTIKVSSGIGPQGPAGAGGVTTLNSLAGAVTLAVVGGTIAAAGNTLTITVTGGGASSWGDLTGKPFTTLGTGLVVVSGVLSATGLAIADTTGLQAALDAKAPLASPTFTGTVGGITKTMVGLGSVDNTADASKPVSTAQAAADAAVQAHAIQRANHTGTQAVETITGLGGAATLSVGTAAGTVAAGDDARLSDARTPTAHNQAFSTITATPTTLAGYGITDGQKTITSGTAAPSGGSSGDIYLRYSP